MSSKAPTAVVALSSLGGIAVLAASVFLSGSFYIENEIGRAFCLGAFFSGMAGALLLFGFAKVFHLLEGMRVQLQAAGGLEARTLRRPMAG